MSLTTEAFFRAIIYIPLLSVLVLQPFFMSAIASHVAPFSSAISPGIILYGGESGVALGDLWRYDGQTGWTQLFPSNEGPGPRANHGMAFDAERARLILFGGQNGPNIFNDTWAFDGERWIQISAPQSPSPRWEPNMAYDSNRRVVVLFGGGPGGYVFYDDTWEFDGARWSQINTQHSPPGSTGAKMVYDQSRRRVVLVTAWQAQGFGWKNETWEYDGTDWTYITQAPSWRYNFQLAYDSRRERVVLFSGYEHGGNACSQSDTWEYDGQTWRRIETRHAPPGRCGGGMAFDPVSQTIVLYGGGNAGITYDDTWRYDGNDWQEVSLAQRPPARQGAALLSVAPLVLPPQPSVAAVRVFPSELFLRDGQTTSQVGVLALDNTGTPLPLTGRRVVFFTNNPAVAQVSDSGVVTAVGYGTAYITASVDGIISDNTTTVIAGRITLEPPILLLSTDTNPTGQVSVQVETADGTPVSLAGKTVLFTSSSPQVASVDNSGLVTAHRPPQNFGETPYINVMVDGVTANNAVVVRVTADNLGISLLPLETPNVVFWIPQQIGSFNYHQIFDGFDAVRITDIAYQLEEELSGLRPFNGGFQFLVNDPGHGGDGTVPCGLSGNPIRLGTDVDKPVHNSCMIVAYPPAIPQWGVFFHEMGHNFTWASVRFAQFASGSDVDNSNFAYSEGLASAEGMYVAQRMKERASQYGIPQATLDDILAVYHFGSTPDLDAYVLAGADYSQINPNVVDDIILRLGEEYGYDTLYRFFSAFLPRDRNLPFVIDNDAKQATFFAAAMSSAARADLKSRFRDEWGFPIDEGYYNQIWPEVSVAVAGRNPIANAGPDRVIAVGHTLTLDGSASYQPLGGFLNYTWSFVSRPPGSTATLTDATTARPSFTPDVAGTYMLQLVVDNGVLSSEPDDITVIALVTPWKIYLPLIARSHQEPQLLGLQTDPAGDWIAPMPRSAYMDIRETRVWQTDENHLRFEMKLDDNIPLNPPGGQFYGWFLDTDLNSSTGQHYNDIGSDYNVQVSYFPGYGWAGLIFDIGGGGVTELISFTISGDTVNFTIPLAAIGSPRAFNWISIDQDDVPYYADIAPNGGHIHVELPTR